MLKESINHSLLNLLSYPWIGKKVENEELLVVLVAITLSIDRLRNGHWIIVVLSFYLYFSNQCANMWV